MALTKSNGSITQLTATGNSVTVDVSDSYASAFSIRMTNGSATITVGASVQPEISHDGTNWRRDGGAFVFSTTASATEFRTYTPPTDGLAVKNVRFAYTAPTGGSGHTLDCDYTKTTAL
jgi:hypothetical protein